MTAGQAEDRVAYLEGTHFVTKPNGQVLLESQCAVFGLFILHSAGAVFRYLQDGMPARDCLVGQQDSTVILPANPYPVLLTKSHIEPVHFTQLVDSHGGKAEKGTIVIQEDYKGEDLAIPANSTGNFHFAELTAILISNFDISASLE